MRADPRHYRVPVPEPRDHAAWPADWGTRFLICVDTEEEFDWTQPVSSASRSVSATAALPAAHAWFADRGVPIVYLVDYPIVSDPRTVDLLRVVAVEGGAEIGAQLHPWVNPPYADSVPGDSYSGRLPKALQDAKLSALTDAITAAFDVAPRVFRAGRYGIGPDTAELLRANGYRIDSSMRSTYDYTKDGGPDFSAIGNAPFWMGSPRDLLELPLTSVFTGAARRFGPGLYRWAGHISHARGALARTGLLARVAMTPEDMPLADVLRAVHVAVEAGLPLLSFAFHSPSLVPGHTPYVRDATELAQFWRWWEGVLNLLDRLGVRPVSIDTILDAAE